jgi:long-subunit fatty acid transport protein
MPRSPVPDRHGTPCYAGAASMSHCADTRRFVALPRSWCSLLGLSLVVALASPAKAQELPEQDEIDLTGRQTLTVGSGARAFGMAGAFLARADDATAAAWNPAGLSYLRTPEISVVGNFNRFDSRFGNDSDTLDGGAIDFGSFAWPFNIKGAAGSVQVSYQRALPFDGSRTVERQHPLGTRIFEGDQTGGFDVLAIGTGVKVTNRLRLGATVNRWFNGYSVIQDKQFPGVIRQRRILEQDFGISGWNSNLGFIYSPVEQFNIAGVFKTGFLAKVDLTKTRTDFFFVSTGEIEARTENSYHSDDVRLDFPWSLGFGISWRPRSTLTLSADYTRANWSEAWIYDYFTIGPTPLPGGEPPQPPPPVFYDRLPYPYVYLVEQNDTEEIRVGVEYVAIRGALKIPLRGGYFNTKRINVLGPTIQDPPRFNGFAVGVGILMGPVLFDVAYTYEWGEVVENLGTAAAGDNAQTTVRNTVKNQRLFASFIYRFGAP